MPTLDQRQQSELAGINPQTLATAKAAAEKAAMQFPNDPVAAAKAYRDALPAAGVHMGAADAMTKQAFPTVNYDQVNRHIGGAAEIIGGVGDVVKKAAPALALIPGVGPIAAGIVGGVGSLAGNLNDQDGFKHAGTDTIAGAAWGYGGAKGIDALAGGGGAAAGGTPAGTPGASTLPIGDAAGVAKKPGVLDTVLGGASKIGKGILKHPEIAAAGASTILGAGQQTAADKQRQQATDIAMADHAETAATRKAILAKLMGPQVSTRPDLSAVFADKNNPYR